MPITRTRALHVLVALAVWLVVAAAVSLALFLDSSRSTVVASHDAVVSPTLDGRVTLRSGPFLPDVRLDGEGPLGVDVQLGKTTAESTEELTQRYALIATNPEGQVAKVRLLVEDMALAALLRGGIVALLPLGVWFLLGGARRRVIAQRLRSPRGVAASVAVLLLGVVAWQPWQADGREARAEVRWAPLGEYVTGIPVPEEAAGIEVRTDVTTAQTRRLLESLVDTYERSQEFYADARGAADDLALREPADDETVAVMVTDRHDNIGMDAVARAIGDQAGATAVLDAGDDTSTGSEWEAFSLDSLDEAFDGYDKYAVAGNHDHGDFVPEYLAARGWTTLDGQVVEGPGGSTLLGAHDPRASGLGTWREETGVTFAEQKQLLADAACGAEERISTLLVHDANVGSLALDRGCVDLVVGGHHHTRTGPTLVQGENGQVGYSFTSGTTGGAAYAIAVGSKLRRPAEVSLITYRAGRPVGVQSVVLRTDGRFEVEEYVEMPLLPVEDEDASEGEGPEDESEGDVPENEGEDEGEDEGAE